MKRIILSILILLTALSFGFSISSGECINILLNNGSQIPYCGPSECEDEYQIFGNDSQNSILKQAYTSCIADSSNTVGGQLEGGSCLINEDCGPNAMCVNDMENSGQKTCITNTKGNMGINMNANCLINGQCSYNIYKTLGIRKSDQDPKVSTFVQDIVLGVTMFLGTVITFILVVSGILYIIAAIQGSSSKADMAKKGIINSLLALILVTGSYALVRLIQFIATAGGG